MAKFSGRIEGMASAPRACGHIGTDVAMLAGERVFFPDSRGGNERLPVFLR
ncbi:TPA: hypothetical protein NI618_001774 [Pseudomonas aeruginosa]|nr:hypothetical protein [Pseudomonas aeruginosa]EIU2835725.1 hypothetical protein [Pseudomonas aeruginosa]EIU2866902.1 hypothetical protein [Pseudomonas aeruginosa]EIU3324516.1 hypothetical protein [Pseudomonas aeruginosa]EIU3441873.1 hypothetical protein [Pseudomonas aeruginosa]